MTKSSLAGAVLAVFTLVAASTGTAVQTKCLVGKFNCVAKKANALLVCHQKAETPRKPADPNFGGCLDKAKAIFDGGANPEKGCFEKLENKPGNDCVSLDDTVDMEALVDQCVADMVAAIDPGPIDQTKCGAAKKKCVAKKIGALLKCHKLAATPNKPMDPNFNGCLDKAIAKFDGGASPAKGCFVKEETKANSDCQPPLNNQAALEIIVDDCVSAIGGALQTPASSTTTTVTTSTTTTTTTAPTTTSTTTTTTTAPTTTSTTTTTAPTTTSTTTTSSTTTTTLGGGSVACGANGLNVTLAIQYPEPLLGGISTLKLRKHYADPPLRIPGSANALTVRQRVTSLLTPGSGSVQVTPAPFGDFDSNDPDLVEDTLEVAATATTPNSIRPGNVFRTRFDCPGGAGTLVSPSVLGCAFLEVGALDGNPMPPELTALITCTVSLATAP